MVDPDQTAPSGLHCLLVLSSPIFRTLMAAFFISPGAVFSLFFSFNFFAKMWNFLG